MSLCEGGASCGKWRCRDELNVKTLIQFMKKFSNPSMSACCQFFKISSYEAG